MQTGGLIKPIDATSIHRICSGQVILDLATAVKELVENAIDAKATSIEVRLRDYGAELIEVADNGHGVSSRDYESLMMKYHTSKISSFEDLESLSSFGFRGEALSSLCAVSEVGVVTRTVDDECGTKLAYDHNGTLISRNPAPRAIGTTVAVSNIFKNLPVRYREFQRTIKREYSKLVSLLQAYALVATNVRMVCTNQSSSGSRNIILATKDSEDMKDNIVTLFGKKSMEALEEVDIINEELDINVKGFVSKSGSVSKVADRHFFFVNGRPVEFSKCTKIINETWRSCLSAISSTSRPMAILDFRLPTDAYDINITPDKRRFMLQKEKMLLSLVQQGLMAVWEKSKSKFVINDALGLIGEQNQRHRIEHLDAKRATRTQRKESSDLHVAGDKDFDICENKVAKIKETPTNDVDFKPNNETPIQDDCRKLLEKTLDESPDQDLVDLDSNLEFKSLKDHRDCNKLAIRSNNDEKDSTQYILRKPEKENTNHRTSPTRKRRAMVPLEGFTMAKDASHSPPVKKSLNLRSFENHKSLQNESRDTTRQTLLSFGFKRDNTDDHAKARCTDLTDAEIFRLEGTTESKYMSIDISENEVKEDGFDRINSDESEGLRGDTKLTDKTRDTDLVEIGSRDLDGELEYHRIDAEATMYSQDTRDSCHEIIRKIRVDMTTIRNHTLNLAKKRALSRHKTEEGAISYENRFSAASLARDNARDSNAFTPTSGDDVEKKAEKDLERHFNKEDFKKLQIIGQFNLGFIVAKLGKDLFIIDQHASDERANFERLQASTALNRQPLVVPQQLGLSPVEELVIRENIEAFQKSGFDFKENEETGRLLLSAVPFSKGITFGADDVLEMVGMLHSGEGHNEGSVWRKDRQGNSELTLFPSRVKSMLASRACRSSIMIGKALTKARMEKLVEHMAELRSPWICAHGRPTMRHLALLP